MPWLYTYISGIHVYMLKHSLAPAHSMDHCALKLIVIVQYSWYLNNTPHEIEICFFLSSILYRKIHKNLVIMFPFYSLFTLANLNPSTIEFYICFTESLLKSILIYYYLYFQVIKDSTLGESIKSPCCLCLIIIISFGAMLD